MKNLIDTHIHLDDKRFGDVSGIVNRFEEDEIYAAINNSCDLQTMQQGFDLSCRYKDIYCTIGSHPHEAANHNRETEKLMEKLAQEEKVVAVGEIGLDYYYDHADRKTQKEVFLRQLEMAHSLSLPVTMHLRDCWGDALEILRTRKHLLKNGGVMHCFSGSAEIAKLACDMGLYVSFTGVITFANAKMDDCIRAVPFDRVLSETDGPYLAPVPVRGTVNFPKNVRYVVAKLAQVYGVSDVKMREQILNNAKNCFPRLKQKEKNG